MKVGVVGTGYLGRLHVRVLSEMPEAELVGFVEVNDAVAGELAQKFNVQRFHSAAEIASHIDCAVVATPTVNHYEVTRELLEAGCDVLV